MQFNDTSAYTSAIGSQPMLGSFVLGRIDTLNNTFIICTSSVINKTLYMYVCLYVYV